MASGSRCVMTGDTEDLRSALAPQWRNLYAKVPQFRLALALVARAPRSVAARLGWRGGHHAALRKLPGVGPYPTEPGDGAAPGRHTRRAAAAAECVTVGSRVRTGLAGKRPCGPRTGDDQPRTRPHAGPAGTVSRPRGGQALECLARQRGGGTADGLFDGTLASSGGHRHRQYRRRVNG